MLTTYIIQILDTGECDYPGQYTYHYKIQSHIDLKAIKKEWDKIWKRKLDNEEEPEERSNDIILDEMVEKGVISSWCDFSFDLTLEN